VTELKALTIFF